MSTTSFSTAHPMRASQQLAAAESGVWTLCAGQALCLPVGPGARELHVTHGRVWLTRTATMAAPSEDVWLRTGDSLRLVSGSEWVIEGWGEAHFQLLVPPDTCPEARRLSALAWSPAVRPSSSSPATAWPAGAATG